MTSVWLFEPRSHGRKREGTRARNDGAGPVAGASTQFSRAPSIGVCDVEHCKPFCFAWPAFFLRFLRAFLLSA